MGFARGTRRGRAGRATLTLLAAAGGLAAVVGLSEACAARAQARALERRLDVMRQWTSADAAFIDGDRARALLIYAGLAEATGDSALLKQRAAYDSTERAAGQTPSSTERDYARLVARLAHAEALLARGQANDEGRADGRDDPARELELTIERQLSEIRRLRTEMEQRRERTLLRFRSEKKRDEVVYLGDVLEGQAHGYGIGVWSSGSTYDGQWRANLRHGHGVFRWKDGERYDGAFVNDLRTGQGTYRFKSGERWDGEWLDDRRHGEGILYDAKGRVRVRGRWERDKLVQEHPATARPGDFPADTSAFRLSSIDTGT